MKHSPAKPKHNPAAVISQETSFLKYRPSLLVLGISLLLSLVIFFKMRELESTRLQNEFETLSNNVVAALKDSIEGNLATLNEIGAFYSAGKKIERLEFKRFSDYVLERRSDIYMLSWIPRISSMEVPTYTEAAAADGLPDFEITQYLRQGVYVRAKNRSEYFPIFYVEPLVRNSNMLGLDQMSNKATSDAMLKAQETGRPASTIAMPLPQFEKEPPASRFGFQVFMPIYKNGASLETQNDREKNLQGFVCAAFHIRRMLESLLGNLNAPEMEMRIFSESIDNKDLLIYTYNPQSSDKLAHSRHISSEINIAGQTWRVVCSSTKIFNKNRYRWEAPFVFVIGVFLGFLLAFYVFSFERGRIRKIMIALSLTDELTGLYNRRGFWLLADEQIRLAQRNKNGFWLLTMDLNLLKKINDTLGHSEGDRAIKRTAQTLNDAYRKSDIVARLGGDEFAVLAIDSKKDSLPVLMEHVRLQLEKANSAPDALFKVSFSIGAAYYDSSAPCSFEELMDTADKVLYEDKKNHRAQHAKTDQPPPSQNPSDKL